MKMFKAAIINGVMLTLALQSVAGAAAADDPKTLEINMAWAQTMAETPDDRPTNLAWQSHWRNEAGRIASELILPQLDSPKPGSQPTTAAATDPNAQFRAAPTPEANLARSPAPKVATGSDYVPTLRPGETAGLTTDYSRIDSLISRQPTEPTSTATVIPPVMGYGMVAPSMGYMGYGWGRSWGGGMWGGRSGWWAGQGGYWVAPCVLAAPVYYDPYYSGGISGGFFYRSRNVAIGVGF